MRPWDIAPSAVAVRCLGGTPNSCAEIVEAMPVSEMVRRPPLAAPEASAPGAGSCRDNDWGWFAVQKTACGSSAKV